MRQPIPSAVAVRASDVLHVKVMSGVHVGVIPRSRYGRFAGSICGGGGGNTILVEIVTDYTPQHRKKGPPYGDLSRSHLGCLLLRGHLNPRHFDYDINL